MKTTWNLSLNKIFTRLLALASAALLLTPVMSISALGNWGSDNPDDKPYTPPPAEVPVDEGEGGGDVEIEIDETLPAHARNLRAISPLPEGKLASRNLAAGDEIVTETGLHALYFNPETLAIKVLDKETDYVWSSGLAAEDVSRLSAVWKSFASLPVSIDYMDPKQPSSLLRDYPQLEASRKTDTGLDLDLYFPRAKITLTLNLALEDHLSASIQDESIVYEEGEARRYDIAKIYLMPFWGAVENDETTGYLFVPDGTGALIRFGDARRYESGFSSRIFGSDEGVSRQGMTFTQIPRVRRPIVHMPVYGISHGNKQQAVLTVVHEGAEYADITASPAGVRTNFYWVTASFNYNEAFFQPTGRGGEGFPYVTRQANTVNPALKFYFLRDEAADYVGMANAYSHYLAEGQGLPPLQEQKSAGSEDIPLLIQTFMAEQERGLLFNRLKVMTTTDDIVSWLPDLHDLAGDNLVISLVGGQNGGHSGRKLGSLGLARRVGGSRGWEMLSQTASGLGIELLMNTELAAGFDPQLSRGDMIYNIDRSIAYRETQNLIHTDRYYLNLDRQTDLISKLAAQDHKYHGAVGLDLSTIGYTLLSDFRDGTRLDRTVVRAGLADSLDRLGESRKLYLESPNSYLWHTADAFYNTPNTHSQLLYETDTVPFLQIVLSGRLPLFSSPMNFGALQQADILNLIDFNLYPTFLVTGKESSELSNSNTQDIYYSEYQALLPDIQQTYKTVNQVLKQVQGAQITGRDVPAEGISVTHYSNGRSVVVNYSAREYVFDGQAVPAQSAAVRGALYD